MRRALAWCSLVFLGGCFGTCSPGGGLRESTKAVCVAHAPPATGSGIELGDDEDGQAFDSLEGKTLHLDYGSQGGMHFYYSLRLYGVTKDSLVFVRFSPGAASSSSSSSSATSSATSSSSSSAGGGGAASSSAGSGGAGSSSAGSGGAGSGGAGGGGAGPPGPFACKGYDDAPDCFESDVIFLFDALELPSCGPNEWLEIKNEIFQMSRPGPLSGTLVAQIGTCAAAGCPIGAGGEHELTTVQASTDVRFGYVP